MTDTKGAQAEKGPIVARDLLKVLAKYREPDQTRSVLELFVTLVPFAILWVAAWWALSISYWLTLAISIPAAAFLVRIFLIQHDCGHGAFFRRRITNEWCGRILGVITMTPYDAWRRAHAIHHASSGNLEKRGTGDIDTLTVKEYLALSRGRRIAYRLYRHPFVMFGIGPAYQFLIRNRFPAGFGLSDRRLWISAMGTNLAIIIVSAAIIALVGFGPFLAVQITITVIAASKGVWLFYVQHQFDETVWEHDKDWSLHDAALYGSSYYDLPGFLRWITANIGIHHVHHLASRIPYYRLQQVLNDHPELAEIKRVTLWQSLASIKLNLWDEEQRKLVSFSAALAAPAK